MAIKTNENKKVEKDDGSSSSGGGDIGGWQGVFNGGGGSGPRITIGGQTVGITPGSGGFGAVRPTTGTANPNIRGDGWRVDEEEDALQIILDGILRSPDIVNGVNMDIINDAIRNLPIPDLSGQRLPIQTGTPPQPVTEPPPEPVYPDETGRPTVGSGSVPSGGNGQVPNPPSTGGGGDNIFDRIFDIFRNPIFGGGNPSTPPFFPDPGGDMTYDDLLNLPIFGGGGQGGSSSATATGGNASNSLGDILTDVVSNFDFGGLIGDLGDTVINNALSADAYEEIGKQQDKELAFRRGIYDEDVARLDPYNKLGLRNINGAEAAANKPSNRKNVFQGQEDITTGSMVERLYANGGLPQLKSGTRQLNGANPNVSYNAPTRTKVNVNQNNPFDLENDIGYNFLKKEMSDSVQGSAAASGGLLSGDALEALQDRSAGLASTYAGQLQNIYSARDGLNLAADSQYFGQGMDLAGLDLGAQGQEFGQNLTLDAFLDQMNRQDLADASKVRGQLFTEDLAGSGFDRETEQLGVENQFRKNAQLYDQLFNYNSQESALDTNEFQKLLALVSGGQSAAAGQSSLGAGFADSIGQILSDKGYLDFSERSDRNDNYLDLISKVFS